MGATEEQMLLVEGSAMDHVSYILILFSMAFLVFLFANMLVHLHDRLVNPPSNNKTLSNGYHAAGRPVEGVRDAEEFELEGLTSDEEDEERGMLRNGNGQGTASATASAEGRP